MKRLGLIAALLLGSAISAHADTDIWDNMLTLFYLGLSVLVTLLNKPASLAGGGDAH